MILYIGALVLGLLVYFKYIRKTPTEYEIISPFYATKYWLMGEEKADDTTIKPFKINIPDADIEDLHRRIDSTRYPTKALQDSKFLYGVNQNFMKEFVEYWRNSYSWKEKEEELNKFDHFTTQIEGLEIHFVHMKPKNVAKDIKPKPLLLSHGWPGSFYEFHKIIPMLIDPTSHGGNETDTFEVIAPSIPGYGFSQAPELQGFNSLHCSRIFHKLMERIGHRNYYVQGGDWGTVICTHMAMMYPNFVKGVHVTMAIAKATPLQNLRMLLGTMAPHLFYNSHVANKNFPLKKFFAMLLRETGYLHLQATKPDTIGFALTDSPVGLAAYFVEKFSSWTNMDGREKEDGDLARYWTKDELLTNIMIYWWSGNVTSSMRFYKESFFDAEKTRNVKVRVPAGYAEFPHELQAAVKENMEATYIRLVSFNHMKDGGHFNAWQVPHLLVEDIRHFVRRVEGMYHSVDKEEDFRQTHLDRFEK